MLRDLLSGKDQQISAIVEIVNWADPDILVLTDFDYDHEGFAAGAFGDLVGLAYSLSLLPNSGMATGLDLDRNGRTGEARDAQGYGRFAGNGGMLVLARFPLELRRDYSALLWRDLPRNLMPDDTKPDVAAVQRLSSVGHWVIDVQAPTPFSLATFSATPPVFDGPEDRNGRRNADEIMFWRHWMDGWYSDVPNRIVIAGNANLDPRAGEGRRGAIQELISDPRLNDPLPFAPTAHWEHDNGGSLRVSYILPDAHWAVIDAGVFDPAPSDPLSMYLGEDGLAAGPHRLVWVELGL